MSAQYDWQVEGCQEQPDMPPPVFCRDCDCVLPSTREDRWWKWRCIKHPRPLKQNFVDPEGGALDAPYERCERINMNGECGDFEPRRAPAIQEAESENVTF